MESKEKKIIYIEENDCQNKQFKDEEGKNSIILSFFY